MIDPICFFTASDYGRCLFHVVAITERVVIYVTVQSCDKLQCVTGPLTIRTNLVENLRTIYDRLFFLLLPFFRLDPLS